MSDQLQDLLQRVYTEGVEKAELEANSLLEKAKAEADQILTSAKQEAERIMNEASKKASELNNNTVSDLKIAAQHTMNTIQSKIRDLILDSVFNHKVSADFKDDQFMRTMILEIVSNWAKSHGDAQITFSKEMQDKLDANFLDSIKKLFDNGLKIDFNPTMKNGFTISPLDGSYKLSFTEEDFSNLFKSFLRPRTQALVFNE